ncbi:MAG: methionine--tRNA ligase [Armatimonadota bacterium]
MDNKVFYITTPIYYVNDVPHIGNAYTTLISDVVARFQRLRGREVLFATGTDENATKVAEAAEAAGMDTKAFVDSIAPKFKEVWKDLEITNDDFIRTTEPRHIEAVQEAFRRLRDKGDIYKGTYEGWYCVSDETFFRESEVTDGLCPNPECRKPVSWVQEENYYFRLSAYQDKLLEWIEANPGCLQPEFRKNEVVSFIKQGLHDISISRTNRGWGIPVPDEPDKVIYVWFDALINYLTIAGWLTDKEKFERTWPTDVQLMGKEIFVRFHCTFWPAILMGLGLPLPKVLFGHGFWSIEGEKISKSKGNAISPAKLAADLSELSGATREVSVDTIRYFVAREVPLGQDADFSWAALIHRFNSDLANDLGNLLNRTLSMVRSYFGGIIPENAGIDAEMKAKIVSAVDETESAFLSLEFTKGLEAIWQAIASGNRFIDDKAPWRLMKEGKKDEAAVVLYSVMELLRSTAIMVSPLMPTVAKEIWRQLGTSEDLSKIQWADAVESGRLTPGTEINGPQPIFPRIDEKKKKEKRVETEQPKETEAKPEQAYITYDEFSKLDIRVAEIKTAERVPKADKLLQLTVDDGSGERTIVAGVAQYYEPETLVGRKIVLLANLQPAKIRGVESHGMMLAADIDGRAVILRPDEDVPAGSKVR